jgi:hypothetical protein
MDDDELSGLERRELQRENGVDVMVDDINSLRFRFGNDAVKVTTPKAETTLRKGSVPQIPLGLTVALNGLTVISLSFPPAYPWTDSLILSDIQIHDPSSVMQNKSANLEEIKHAVQELINRRDGHDEERGYHYTTVMPIIDELKARLEPLAIYGNGNGNRNGNGKEGMGDDVEADLVDQTHRAAIMPMKEDGAFVNVDADAEVSVTSAGDHSQESEQQQQQQQQQEQQQEIFGCCMFCGQVLFEESDLEYHEPPTKKDGETCQGMVSISTPSVVKKDTCGSYFLNKQPDWMQPSSETLGKLSCGKCNKKMGLWNWSGSQCSCGTWVVPAFQINSSRVDIKKRNKES